MTPILMANDHWNLRMDQATGAILHIENRGGALRQMNWMREPGKWDDMTWVAALHANGGSLEGQWGLIETAHTGLLHAAKVTQLTESVWEAVYISPSITVTVRRELTANSEFLESYTFTNTARVTLEFPLGSVAILAPFFDQYPDAKQSLYSRCHAHLWMGGSCAWVNAMRMDNEPPHLGLVVTQGCLDAYSQRGGTISDRGVFLLHPEAMTLNHGESKTIAWKLFWHRGWDDFFVKLKTTDGFLRLSAEQHTVTLGHPLKIAVESAELLKGAELLANGDFVEMKADGGGLSAVVPTDKVGEVFIEVRVRARRTCLRGNVTPPLDNLIAERLKFIVKHQQHNAPGEALDGAYLSFDNETGGQVHDPKRSDLTAGRERLGMGVLGALYLPRCQDESFKLALERSLSRYAAFVARELEDDSGVVYNDVGRVPLDRLYNYPWVAHFHLAMYRATGETAELDRFVRVMRTYYALGGAEFYGIGIPATAGIDALGAAGRGIEKDELISALRAHADHLLSVGRNYPTSEVNYEQAIVGPSVQLLCEAYEITGEQRYLEGAKEQMPLLEAFCGKQPDHRLHEVAIRHWDDFWFGKLKLYGDTFPHYWSTINGMAYAYYGLATGESGWFPRAEKALMANLSLFSPDGSASCAHVYPRTCNGRPAARNAPWANDQDWALVNLLAVRDLSVAASARL